MDRFEAFLEVAVVILITIGLIIGVIGCASVVISFVQG